MAKAAQRAQLTGTRGAEDTAAPRVVVAGNLTIDDVVLPDGSTTMAATGGNAVYAALGARLWEPRVGIVTRCGDDFPPFALERLRDPETAWRAYACALLADALGEDEEEA